MAFYLDKLAAIKEEKKLAIKKIKEREKQELAKLEETEKKLTEARTNEVYRLVDKANIIMLDDPLLLGVLAEVRELYIQGAEEKLNHFREKGNSILRKRKIPSKPKNNKATKPDNEKN